MVKVRIESVSKNQVLIPKKTLEELIHLAQQVDQIEIDEVFNETKRKRGALRGIWKGAQISEDLFLEARRSLFSYKDT